MFRQCSQPGTKAKESYEKVKFKEAPFKKI